MIKFGSPQVAETEIKNVLKVINSGVYVHGPMSASFVLDLQKDLTIRIQLVLRHARRLYIYHITHCQKKYWLLDVKNLK